jgi:cytochrome c biogenesis protein CcdA
MYFNKRSLHKFQENFFNLFITISWILIIISALGFSQFAPSFLDGLDYYVRIYICLFLIWRFHPFRSHYEFTDLDRKIAFSAGLFILTTTVLNKYLLNLITLIKQK